MDYLCIIVMFLSAVWTLILTAPIHCRGFIAETLMQCYISPNLMKKQTHLHLGWPEGEGGNLKSPKWFGYFSCWSGISVVMKNVNTTVFTVLLVNLHLCI